MSTEPSTIFPTAPLSVLHTLVGHFATDARDFLERFDRLWEAMLHKTGRIKSFVDLLFACECALKAHIILRRVDEDPDAVYKDVRRWSHNLDRLATEARLIDTGDVYQGIRSRLGPFSVFIRYSLDAYETFFPSLLDRADAPINYSATIGRNPWVLECRALVGQLLPPVDAALRGFVTDDLEALFTHEEAMRAFAERHTGR